MLVILICEEALRCSPLGGTVTIAYNRLLAQQ